MSEPDEVSAEDRIATAVRLIDAWMGDESAYDLMRQRAVWNNLREVREALTGEQS